MRDLIKPIYTLQNMGYYSKVYLSYLGLCFISYNRL